MNTSPTADQPTDEELISAFEQHIDRSIAASMPVVEAQIITYNDLIKKIEDEPLSSPPTPKMPALEWRMVDCYDRLYIGGLQVGFAVRFRDGWKAGLLSDAGNVIIKEGDGLDWGGAKAAVEKAVREALGWTGIDQ